MKPKRATVFEKHIPPEERDVPKPKRRKKKTLGQHADEFLAKYKRGCTRKSRCALMSASLAVAKEDEAPLGLYEGLTFSTNGAYKGTEVVYFARRAQYAVVSYCPFCGGKLGKQR